jgi:hypothetical protein
MRRPAGSGTDGSHLTELDEQPDLAVATPASLYALGTILAQSTQQLDAGRFQFALQACSGPSAANLLGRFCYGDEQLLNDVREKIHQTEPDTDKALITDTLCAAARINKRCRKKKCC